MRRRVSTKLQDNIVAIFICTHIRDDKGFEIALHRVSSRTRNSCVLLSVVRVVHVKYIYYMSQFLERVFWLYVYAVYLNVV